MLAKGISGTLWIAPLARFDELLGFVQSCGVNKNDVLLFGSWIEEVVNHVEDTTRFTFLQKVSRSRMIRLPFFAESNLRTNEDG